ncbi:MAG: 2-oxoacid:acceptor oxidoreductase family protein [Gemmatimonadota bacterium]
MIMKRKSNAPESGPRYPGVPEATDGSGAVVYVETAASEAAGAYPITPSTQMGEGWALAVAAGHENVHGRRLLFFEPEGEHAAAAVTAGMSMTGLRATNFSSGQGIAYMHESLYAAVGKRLTYVLNVAARAMTKHALNVHAGHDDYHAVDDTGFLQFFAKDVQETADLTLIAHRAAELSLTPALVAQDGFLTSHVIESIKLPERELIAEYLGDPADMIECPTPAQRLTFGPTRRRIPEMFDVDYPTMLGPVQNQDAYAQGVAAQRPFYFDHARALIDRSFEEYAALTGRRYERVMGYRLEDAEYVIAGQGSVVPNAEAVVDFMRAQGVKVGVLNLTLFRPFPADLVTQLLRGKQAVAVLERVDQPLAVDPPLLREIRAAFGQAQENGRAEAVNVRKGRGVPALAKPHADLASVRADELPDFYSGGFGFGSRDLQPGDIVAAVRNMMPEGAGRRRFYLGLDFIRKDTKLPKLQVWQEELLENYPHLAHLSLEAVEGVDLSGEGSVALRIHSVGGWGAITTGKNVALTAFELAGLHIKANPKYGSEKKGQPTTFYATLSREPIRVNAELKNVNVVLSPDPNVFRHSNPLAGLGQDGVFVIQSDLEPAALWAVLSEDARRTVREKNIQVYVLDGFSIANEEASDPELRYRMQGAAFMGAFFRTGPLARNENLSEERIFEGIETQLRAKFGKLGERVIQDNVRVIRRGWDEVLQVDTSVEVAVEAEVHDTMRPIPALLNHPDAEQGLGNPGRFFEQVCAVCAVGQDVIADPFTAVSAMPAASSSVRDMTDIRFEVPDFIAEKCTGCSQCWVQCPDAAIPGLVTPVEDLIERAIEHAANGRALERVRQISKHLAKESRKVMEAVPFHDFGQVVSAAYHNVADKLGWEPERRAELDEQFAAVHSVLAEFPLARTAPFYDVHEGKAKGTGGLLSITINPEACKGCNICVEVCPENALITIKQDEEVVERLRRNWNFWEALPDTSDRYVNVSNVDEGIGVLSSLLLKKKTYRSMVGGDGACMGCGEKTTVHLVTSTIEALMQPRVKRFVARLEELIGRLDEQARDLLSADADLDLAALAEGAHVDVPLDDGKRETLQRIVATLKALRDLKWRYEDGPSGEGRASMGITNSTGCSSVWASTYPYNPYPYPWANHLFQDAPSLAIGVFEGHMRKMADAFVAVRRAELILDGSYDAARDEPFFTAFDYREFTDEEFQLCPPIMAIGGDGAMLDIGFQNLSRLLASGKPIRVMVLDTQVYSNTGGQACTSGFTGQVADMSAYGKAQHGKTETRKELALLALAHRGAFVHQSSQANASHLIAGVIKGLNSRRPAVFNIYTPCPVEHGLPDEWAPYGAKLALESRAFPFMTYDPDGGASIAECISLEGNPAIDDPWPTYELTFVNDEGEEETLELPLSTADWAATEGRFKKHFKELKPEAWTEDMVPFHEFVFMGAAEREGKEPFIHALGKDRQLVRKSVSMEMVTLAEDRLLFWGQLRELAGLAAPEVVRDAVRDQLEAEFDARAEALRTEYEGRMAELKAAYPPLIARRMAEGLLKAGAGDRTVAELLEVADRTPGLQPIRLSDISSALAAEPAPSGNGGGVAVAEAPAAVEAGAAPAPAPAAVEEDEDGGLAMEPYIDTARCTTCNECTNLNGKMFAYNEDKQAYIKDPKAGTFAQLVQAAERCPAALIHPGTPLNPKEKDLEKWLKRAEPFS